jgi:hypothetical protein
MKTRNKQRRHGRRRLAPLVKLMEPATTPAAQRELFWKTMRGPFAQSPLFGTVRGIYDLRFGHPKAKGLKAFTSRLRNTNPKIARVFPGVYPLFALFEIGNFCVDMIQLGDSKALHSLADMVEVLVHTNGGPVDRQRAYMLILADTKGNIQATKPEFCRLLNCTVDASQLNRMAKSLGLRFRKSKGWRGSDAARTHALKAEFHELAKRFRTRPPPHFEKCRPSRPDRIDLYRVARRVEGRIEWALQAALPLPKKVEDVISPEFLEDLVKVLVLNATNPYHALLAAARQGHRKGVSDAKSARFIVPLHEPF